jgi:hypothetical protein
MDRELSRTENMFVSRSDKSKLNALPGESDGTSLDKTIEAVLTPDQKKQYDEIASEEKRSQTEMMVTIELNQSVSGLGLSEEQKDRMYQALYQLHKDQFDPAKMKERGASGSPSEYLENTRLAKETAMKEILSAPQMEIYRKNLQRQFDLQKQYLDKFSPPQP